MAPQPEQQVRGDFDRLLEAAGWHVCDASAANIHAARGVAIREFPLPGYGFADYLLYVDGKAAGVIEAKKEGVTLTGVETQSDKYTQGLPRWSNPLPFAYQTTGIETRKMGTSRTRQRHFTLVNVAEAQIGMNLKRANRLRQSVLALSFSGKMFIRGLVNG